MMWEGCDMYLRSIDSWNTLWTRSSCGGSAKRYASYLPNLFQDLKWADVGDNFPFFSNQITPCCGLIFINTCSPAWKDNGLVLRIALLSALSGQKSLANDFDFLCCLSDKFWSQ